MNEDNFSVEKAPETLRIVTLGDSCTFGWGVKREENYSSLLQKKLSTISKKQPIKVLNAGHTGFTSFQGKILLQRFILKLSPDYITVSFGMNDHTIEGASIPDNEVFKRNISFLGKLFFYAQKSDFFLLALRGFNKLRNKTKTMKNRIHINRVSLSDFDNNIKDMANICKTNKIKMVIISQPHQLWQKEDEQYYQKLIETAKAENLPLIDCALRFRHLQTEWNISKQIPNKLFIDTIHPQKEGHLIIAEMVFSYFKKQLNQKSLYDKAN